MIQNAIEIRGLTKSLGKELANRLAPIVSDDGASTQGLDASTAGLIAYRRGLKI